MRKLKANEIDVKVKQITANGCLLLLYKTARVDMQILDEEFGVNNWQCDYKTINNALYCGIGVWSEQSKGYVWKWDCGIESRADDEGNEKKGEASDAFKRAGFKWGIGRELYTTPFIWAKVAVKQDDNKKWVLADKYQKFFVKTIIYNDLGEISALCIVDNNNKVVYKYATGGQQEKESAPQAPTQTAEDKAGALLEMGLKLGKAETEAELIKVCKELKAKYPSQKAELVKRYNARLEEIKDLEMEKGA